MDDKNFTNPVDEELFTIPETGKKIKRGRTGTYELINEGRLEAVKLGRSTLVKGSSIRKLIASLPLYAPGAQS